MDGLAAQADAEAQRRCQTTEVSAGRATRLLQVLRVRISTRQAERRIAGSVLTVRLARPPTGRRARDGSQGEKQCSSKAWMKRELRERRIASLVATLLAVQALVGCAMRGFIRRSCRMTSWRARRSFGPRRATSEYINSLPHPAGHGR